VPLPGALDAGQYRVRVDAALGSAILARELTDLNAGFAGGVCCASASNNAAARNVVITVPL